MNNETPPLTEVATDKAKVMVYMDPDYKKGLEQLAELDGRSMSNYIEMLIREKVDAARQEGKIK